jgi:hypothetical protein
MDVARIIDGNKAGRLAVKVSHARLARDLVTVGESGADLDGFLGARVVLFDRVPPGTRDGGSRNGLRGASPTATAPSAWTTN